MVQNAPHRGVVAAERARAGRGDTLRMIEAGQVDDAAAKPSVPPPAARREAAAKPRPEPAREETGAEPEDIAEPEAPSAAKDGDRAAPADPETAKRLATIQAAEKRQREKADARQRELDAAAKKLEADWAPRIKAAEDFEALKSQARKGPAHLVEAMRALGLGEDDFEAAAQALYASSKAGAADPARKAAAERMMREREQTTELSATQKRLADLEAKLEAKEQASQFETLKNDYLDNAIKAIGDTTPIAKAAAAKNPDKLRARLWAATVELTEENEGDVPDFADVVARYEEIRGAELDELGIPRPTATTTTATTTKPNDKTADKQTPARTLSNDLSTTRVPRQMQSGDAARKDSRRETLRALESGKLD